MISNHSEPLIEFKDVHVRFRQQTVLRRISIQVRRGETLVIIGESGCGKTVMLKNMIGLIRPSSGEVFFDGRSVTIISKPYANTPCSEVPQGL